MCHVDAAVKHNCFPCIDIILHSNMKWANGRVLFGGARVATRVDPQDVTPITAGVRSFHDGPRSIILH
jgi:hypothetical protein